MTKVENALLNLLRDVLRGTDLSDPALSPEEWQTLLRRAEAHKLLPLILDAACSLRSCRAALRPAGAESPVPSAPVGADAHIGPPAPAGAGIPDGPSASRKCHSERSEESASPVPPSHVGADAHIGPSAPDWKALVLSQFARQVLMENEFLDLILTLRGRGLEPIVLKGPVCRALYPKPLLRPSVDNDLLIPDDQGPAYSAALLDLGLSADDPDADPETAWELSWHKPGSPLYIEAHKRLFDPISDALRGFNEPFDGASERAVPVRIQDVTLRTLAPQDHLLFLLLHAFKHFLHSGFGLRIVSDVCLYARRYAEEIDFDRVLSRCAALRCDRFAAALFRIGESCLDLPAPAPFAALKVDETPLLEDVLAAGLLGEEIDRLHSANITMGAVADQNTGRAPSDGLRRALFPSAKQLSGRFPWLEKHPWLLPAAWIGRAASYLKERGKYGGQSPAASLRIGKERVALLKTYGIIDE